MRSSGPLICILGLGEAGLIHAEALLATGARVACASRRGKPPAFADKFYDNYEEPLLDPDVSGVVIATPYDTHPALVSKAGEAGKHILVEKPLGANLHEAISAGGAARKVRTMTGFMRRWDPGYYSARQKVSDGTIGKPLVLRTISGDAEYPEKYRRPGGASPGAMFKDLAVHDIDLARWFLMDEVATVYARSGALIHPEIGEMGDVDTAVAVLGMSNGGSAVLTLSRALNYGHKVSSELIGSKASVEIGDMKRTEISTAVDGSVRTDIRMDFRERFSTAFKRQMKGFVDLVNADDTTAKNMLKGFEYATYDDGLRATIVAEALCLSADSGRPIEVEQL